MSQFYLSLEDDLMKRFGSERIKAFLDRMKIGEEDACYLVCLRAKLRRPKNASKEITTIHVNKSFNTMTLCVNNVRLSMQRYDVITANRDLAPEIDDYDQTHDWSCR